MIRRIRGPVAYGHHRGVAVYRSVKDDKGASHFYCDVTVNDWKHRVIALSLSDLKKLIDVSLNADLGSDTLRL
jgi:hypothetical protein